MAIILTEKAAAEIQRVRDEQKLEGDMLAPHRGGRWWLQRFQLHDGL